MATEDTGRYTRANLTVVDVFTNMMRDLLKSKVSSPNNLHIMTQQAKFQKILQKEEKAMVGTILKSQYAELDIGLTYKILRFFKFISAPSRGWGNIPTPSDITIADDVERIRISRNSLLHRPNPSLTENEMNSLFAEFVDISVRFDNHLCYDPQKGYCQKVEAYRRGTIDPETERKYKEAINYLKEQHSSKHQNHRITVYFPQEIQDLFQSDYPREEQIRLKVFLPGVVNPAMITKILTSMIMEIVQMNYDIILDNAGEGSLVLYLTVPRDILQQKKRFLDKFNQLLRVIITKAKIDFVVPNEVQAVIAVSDPFVDDCSHKIYSESDDAIYDLDAAIPSDDNDSDEEQILFNSIQEATFQMTKTRLDSMEVEKALIEQATKNNSENIKNELRLIMIGKTGVGKSALGNFICGKKEFDSKSGSSSVTRECTITKCIHKNRKVVVIDTPGILGTEHDTDYVEAEIRKCIGMGSPGPHAILFVMSLAERFKNEDKLAIREFIKFFGKDMLNYVIVAFTHSDYLTMHKTTLEEHLKTSPPQLQDLLSSCGNRYVHLNTKAKGEDRQSQLKTLYQEIDSLKLQNYENDNFRATEKLVSLREEEIAAEVERRLKKIQDEIKERTKAQLESTIKETVMQLLLPCQKLALQRIINVRDEVRSEIEHNQSQFVINGTNLNLHESVIDRFKETAADK